MFSTVSLSPLDFPLSGCRRQDFQFRCLRCAFFSSYCRHRQDFHCLIVAVSISTVPSFPLCFPLYCRRRCVLHCHIVAVRISMFSSFPLYFPRYRRRRQFFHCLIIAVNISTASLPVMFPTLSPRQSSTLGFPWSHCPHFVFHVIAVAVKFVTVLSSPLGFPWSHRSRQFLRYRRRHQVFHCLIVPQRISMILSPRYVMPLGSTAGRRCQVFHCLIVTVRISTVSSSRYVFHVIVIPLDPRFG